MYECKYCCICEFLRYFNPNKKHIIYNSYGPFQKENSRNKRKSYKIHQSSYLSTTYYQFDLKLIKINKIWNLYYNVICTATAKFGVAIQNGRDFGLFCGTYSHLRHFSRNLRHLVPLDVVQNSSKYRRHLTLTLTINPNP